MVGASNSDKNKAPSMMDNGSLNHNMLMILSIIKVNISYSMVFPKAQISTENNKISTNNANMWCTIAD